jgi:adenine C2-methylase RlmN of 23S rRNA A2503 and tRNA A37
VRAFADRLREGGVGATIRRTRGVDIDAACGQLRARHPIADSRSLSTTMDS